MWSYDVICVWRQDIRTNKSLNVHVHFSHIRTHTHTMFHNRPTTVVFLGAPLKECLRACAKMTELQRRAQMRLLLHFDAWVWQLQGRRARHSHAEAVAVVRSVGLWVDHFFSMEMGKTRQWMKIRKVKRSSCRMIGKWSAERWGEVEWVCITWSLLESLATVKDHSFRNRVSDVVPSKGRQSWRCQFSTSMGFLTLGCFEMSIWLQKVPKGNRQEHGNVMEYRYAHITHYLEICLYIMCIYII